MRIAVTGCAGFIGSTLAARAVAADLGTLGVVAGYLVVGAATAGAEEGALRLAARGPLVGARQALGRRETGGVGGKRGNLVGGEHGRTRRLASARAGARGTPR